MPISIGMLRRYRERYSRMTPAERLVEDAYWAKQDRIDRLILRTTVAVVIVAVGVVAWLIH